MRLNPRSNISGSDYINADFVKVKSIVFANLTINEGVMIIDRVDEKSWSAKHEKVDFLNALPSSERQGEWWILWFS